MPKGDFLCDLGMTLRFEVMLTQRGNKEAVLKKSYINCAW